MELHDVTYAIEDALALITLNRPKYRNAQSYRLLDELDAALMAADADPGVKVIVLRGSGGNFSSGHDLGTPESLEARALAGVPDSGIEFYENFRRYNLDLTLRWRNITKPTIAMVEGFCIYGGWMIAASMDLVFAASDAKFLAGLLEYFSVPFDVGIRKAKELCFESRFITAEEGKEAGFVSRIYAPEDLERETLDYARRCAENTTTALRMSKLAINKIQDAQGYSNAMEGAFADYFIMMGSRSGGGRVEGMRRLGGVDLAVKGTRGERAGQTPAESVVPRS